MLTHPSQPETWKFTPSRNYVSPLDPKNAARPLPFPPGNTLIELEAQLEYLDKKIASVRQLQRDAIIQRDEEMAKIEAAIQEMRMYEEYAERELERAREEREMKARAVRLNDVVYEPYHKRRGTGGTGGSGRRNSSAETKYVDAVDENDVPMPIAAYEDLAGNRRSKSPYVEARLNDHNIQASGGRGLKSKQVEEPPKSHVNRKPLGNNIRDNHSPAPVTVRTNEKKGKSNRKSNDSGRTVVVDANAVGNTSSWATIF